MCIYDYTYMYHYIFIWIYKNIYTYDYIRYMYDMYVYIYMCDYKYVCMYVYFFPYLMSKTNCTISWGWRASRVFFFAGVESKRGCVQTLRTPPFVNHMVSTWFPLSSAKWRKWRLVWGFPILLRTHFAHVWSVRRCISHDLFGLSLEAKMGIDEIYDIDPPLCLTLQTSFFCMVKQWKNMLLIFETCTTSKHHQHQ